LAESTVLGSGSNDYNRNLGIEVGKGTAHSSMIGTQKKEFLVNVECDSPTVRVLHAKQYDAPYGPGMPFSAH